MANPTSGEHSHQVNFAEPRSYGTALKSDLKECLFPDDPFREMRNQPLKVKTIKALQYFVPVFDWLPKYTLKFFYYDLLAGITIASLAIPQGISYAKLGDLPPIIGLYSSFVPPLVYAVFGSSKYLAVGTVASSSLLIASIISQKANPETETELFVSLVFTATLFTGLLQTVMGVLRLGILVDFLSHSTITGFMGGTAVIICLQQLKGILGLKHFTTKTDVVHVVQAVFEHRNEWRWECALVGIIFLAFLQFTRYVKQKKPKLFWVSAISPIIVVIVGCLFAYFAKAERFGIQTVGKLSRGINPSSIGRLNFESKYLPATFQAGLITALIALAEGIAIGRSFAILKNEHVDGNKEMIAFGLMNIVGSLTSCYLTTGPFSKTAVNYNAGCKSQMSNVVMAICMMLTLLFLAPLFGYTPLVALSAIIMSAMLGLIEYEKAYHLLKEDKFDFCICMTAFFGVAFISMDIGLMLSVGLAMVRALLYVARPASCKLVNLQDTTLYRDVEQYPGGATEPGILVLKVGSPIYFPNCNYIRERVLRLIKDEQEKGPKGSDVEHILLDLGSVTSMDITGIETFNEIRKTLSAKGITIGLVNPRLEVMEKLQITKFIDKIGKENVFLSVDDAIRACRFNLKGSKQVDV